MYIHMSSNKVTCIAAAAAEKPDYGPDIGNRIRGGAPTGWPQPIDDRRANLNARLTRRPGSLSHSIRPSVATVRDPR